MKLRLGGATKLQPKIARPHGEAHLWTISASLLLEILESIPSSSFLELVSNLGLQIGFLGYLGSLTLHHAPAHLAPRLHRLLFATNAGRFVILAPLDFLHDAIALAFLLEAPERLFNTLVFSNFYNDQMSHLPFIIREASRACVPLKCGNADARPPGRCPYRY